MTLKHRSRQYKVQHSVEDHVARTSSSSESTSLVHAQDDHVKAIFARYRRASVPSLSPTYDGQLRIETDVPSEEDLFKYNAQRWLWNENDHLARRYREFNVGALIKAAEAACGTDAQCVNFTKLPEGNFNKTFLLTMRNGVELIARVPNPNAGTSPYVTASEVATMDYVCGSCAIEPRLIS